MIQCPLCVPLVPEDPGARVVLRGPDLHRRTPLCQSFLQSQSILARPFHLDIPLVQENLLSPWALEALGILGPHQSMIQSWTQSFRVLLCLLWVLVFHNLVIQGVPGVPGLLVLNPLHVLVSRRVLVDQGVPVSQQKHPQTVSQLWMSSVSPSFSLIFLGLPCHLEDQPGQEDQQGQWDLIVQEIQQVQEVQRIQGDRGCPRSWSQLH